MKIFETIMQHLDMLSGLTIASKSLLLATQKGDLNLVEQIVENRDRLVNIIKTVQTAIEDEIQNLDSSRVTAEEVNIIKSWGSDVNQIILLNDQIDKKIHENLSAIKDQTSQEISNVYKNRKAVGGYDMTSVKK